MAILKCKICGGDLDITASMSTATCEYCGMEQTIPSVDDDEKLKLFERANRLRWECEYDAAAILYENIVISFPEESEAYWGGLLCKYGIEYVKDPITNEWIPTSHRPAFESITEDDNYKLALKYADIIAAQVYKNEAEKLEILRTNILEISGKEEPYDIFISYKEADENGRRTQDSALAQDIYSQLTQKGYRVFFSRISLEDKIGQEYEPYIFSAIYSARVMIVVGTKKEYCNAVWVKNEWKRFLSLIEGGKKKMMIVCYKNIKSQDLPEEFDKLQAQDMSEPGAIQTLVNGIAKLFPERDELESIPVVFDENALLRRGLIALEDKDWQEAYQFFDQALNINAELAEAYLGMFLVNNKASSISKYIRNRLDETNEVIPKTEYVPEPTAKIQKAVEKYCIPYWVSEEEICNLYPKKLEYQSTYDARKEQIEEERKLFETDRMLCNAFRFATGDFKKQIHNMRQSILDEMEYRLEYAKQSREQLIEKCLSQQALVIYEAESKVNTLYERANMKRKEYYEESCLLQERASTADEFDTAAGRFAYLDDYRDCKERVIECKKQYEMLKQLENQRAIDEQKLQERIQKRKQRRTRCIEICVAVGIILIVLAVVFLLRAIGIQQD